MNHEALVIALFVVDRVAKWWVLHARPEMVFINKGLVGSVPISNGAALVITSAALVAFIWYAIRVRADRAAALLIVAGALSNIFDRLTRGGVVDFIPLSGLTTFNLADMMIIGGALLLIFKKYDKQK